MKKVKILVGVTLFFLIIAAGNAQTVQHNSADVVVLMDTSGTVLPYYEVINKRVLQSIISKFIRIGDFFHLISFSAVPRYEMSQKISTEADLSRVVSRFMLLYQLGQSADFLSGINFAGQYMTKLPSQQEKILIVISDGIFNPPVSSPYRNYTGEQIKTELAKISGSIRAKGWKVYYVKLPFPSDAVIKDLDGTFYAGRLDAEGSLDRSGVDHAAASSDTSTGNTGNASSGEKNYALNTGTNTQNSRAPTRTNGQSISDNTKIANAGSSSPTTDTATGKNDSRIDADGRSISNATQEQSTVTSNVNSHTNNPYGINNTDTSILSDMQGQNGRDTTTPESSRFSSSEASGTNRRGTSDGQGTKEYTDVSQAFTENLGIETSPLSEEGSVEFSDTVLPIPKVIFPERIDVSGNAAELPLTLISEGEESVEIQLQSVSLTTEDETQKQQLNNIIVRISPNGKSELTVRITLPDGLRREGQYRTDIRLDLVQKDKIFSQAAAVLLIVKPAFIQSLLSANLIWILIATLGLLLILLLVIFIFRHRASEPVTHAARMVGNQPYLKQQNNAARQIEFNREQRAAQIVSEKHYYSEQSTNKTDSRNTLNTFSSQTATAAAATKSETAAQFDHLAQERSRTVEGRFTLLNSAESLLNGRPGLNRGYYSGHISTKPSQSGMMELFVYNQNASIGKRNIHMMKPGRILSIGGNKNDDFLIFLVPFPAHIAQVQYDGSNYRVSILKPEYFPYESSNTIYPCIGRDITAVSRKGYHVTFTFRGYEDPMIRLNTILTSINY